MEGREAQLKVKLGAGKCSHVLEIRARRYSGGMEIVKGNSRRKETDPTGMRRGFSLNCADPILERSEFDQGPHQKMVNYVIYFASVSKNSDTGECKRRESKNRNSNILARIRAADDTDKNIQDCVHAERTCFKNPRVSKFKLLSLSLSLM